MTLFPMPRCNRVSPTGEILALASRGRAMGNRGPLIDAEGKIVRHWAYKRWICCTLREVNGRKVRFDDPEGYTPLFFTDEAVALAAGHRPCGSCRPHAYYRWLATWKALAGVSKFERVQASTMDRELHERRAAQRTRSPIRLRLDEVPNGAFVKLLTAHSKPLLLHEGRLWPWKDGDYGAPTIIDRSLVDLEAIAFPNVEFLISGFRFDDELAPVPADTTEGADCGR